MDDFFNSENKYSRYEIQKGDTIESIAEKLNIEFDNLRQYHNSRSKVEDCLAGELPSHLKFIIIAGKNDDKRVEKQKPIPVQFISEDFILPFRSFEIDHKYSVTYTIEKDGDLQTVSQNFSLRRLRPDNRQEEFHFIQVEKISPLLINGKAADNRAYKVAEQTAALLFPLRIIVNQYGKWEDLNSYDTLKERWEKQKNEIRDSFEGKAFEMLATNIEEAIENGKSLIEFMSSNWFLRAFFNGIHAAYTRKFEIEKSLYFPAVAEIDDVEFLITQKVNPYLNELNQIEITQIGESENEYMDGSYTAKYFLNPNNYIIQNIQLECNLEMRSSRKISIIIKDLNENEIVVDSGISLII